MPTKLILLFTIIAISISCEKEPDNTITGKWWKSTKQHGSYVRFENNGGYIKEGQFINFKPLNENYSGNIFPTTIKITGEWEQRGNQIIFKNIDLANDSLPAGIFNPDNSYGQPISNFYGLQINGIYQDTSFINITDDILGRWNPDSTRMEGGFRFNDSIGFNNPQQSIWVIVDVTPDTLECIINNQSEKFYFDKEKE